MNYSDDQLQNILDLLVAKIEDAGGRTVEKVGWFWTILHFAVIVLTLGSNRRFNTNYCTTIGPVIGVPVGWKEKYHVINRIAVLEHELIHIKQCQRLGFGNAWAGLLPYGFLYMLFPLPIGLAYFRWRFERVAYAHSINVELEFRGPYSIDSAVLREWLIDNAVRQLTTGAYAWTWPFKRDARAYFDTHVTPARMISRHDSLSLVKPSRRP